MKRLLTAYVLPTVLLLVWAVSPLLRGTETLFFRDVFNTHLEKKWVQVEAMKAGYVPLVDPYRDGGQPHLGNPNTVSLYPDNLLYLVAPFFWSFNAHFWLHLLLAPFTFYALARAWGLRRESAWAGAVCYAASGFFLSNLSFYNLVAGAAWTPAFVAALLRAARRDGGAGSFLASGLIWTLLLLAGDPMTCLAALFLAGSAILASLARPSHRFTTAPPSAPGSAGTGSVGHPRRPASTPAVPSVAKPGISRHLRRFATRTGEKIGRGLRGVSWLRVLSALLLGTLAAAPQWVEFLRILPLSFRGYQGYSATAATAGSWHPLGIADWLLPFFFGLPDLSFWGGHFQGGELPLFPTLFPGVLALVLVAGSGRPSAPAQRWAWLVSGVGLFVALGEHNPAVGWLLQIPGLDLLRLPVKFWLLVAMGAALLCGLGFERLVARPAGGSLLRLLGGFAVLYVVLWLLSGGASPRAPGWLGGLLDEGQDPGVLERERLRWAGLCLVSLVSLAAFAGLDLLGRRAPRARGPLLLALHLGLQLFLLRPALPMDAVEVYQQPPPLLEHVAASSLVAHGKANRLFGSSRVPVESFPDARLSWLERQVFEELHPVAGTLWGRRYEFSLSAEGLDAFLSRAVAQTLRFLTDESRLRLLAASGVDLLLLDRPLDTEPGEGINLLHRQPTTGGEIRVYRLQQATPQVFFAGKVLRAPHLNAALSWITEPSFDPATTAVLPEGGPELDGPPGELDLVRSGPESLEMRVEAPAPGVLVIQRAFLPIYRATANDRPVPIVAANMHRLGIELPAGRHRVRVWVDRRPLGWASVLAVGALATLIGAAWRRH